MPLFSFRNFFRFFALAIFFSGCTSQPLPKLGQISSFSLTDQDGRTITMENLKGKIWVANFIFTRCGGACPLLTKQMKGVERWMISQKFPDLRIVSFSVDPENDTPAALKAYARLYEVDTSRWFFLTGSMESIHQAVVEGFKVVMGKEPQAADPTLFEIVHGERFVLVDREGKIRGYFEAQNLKPLLSALEKLERESGGKN